MRKSALAAGAALRRKPCKTGFRRPWPFSPLASVRLGVQKVTSSNLVGPTISTYFGHVSLLVAIFRLSRHWRFVCPQIAADLL